MAKKRKVKVANAGVGLCPADSPTLWLQVEKEDIKGLEIGQTVTLVIKGKVAALEQRESYGDQEKVTHEIRVRDYEVMVEGGGNVFEELSKEDDDE